MTCSTTSNTSRFLLKPIFPVAQNKQPNGQPIWEETQTVFLFLCRIKTDSIFKPSSRNIKALAVFLSFEIKNSPFIERGHSLFKIKGQGTGFIPVID